MLDDVKQAHILKLHLEKFPRFKVGDRVRFKRPKKNPIEGTIIAVENNVKQVTWVQATPLFLTVRYDDRCVINGVTTTKTSGKKLLYMGQV